MVKKKIALIFSTVIDLSIDDDYFKIIPLPLFEKKNTSLIFKCDSEDMRGDSD